MYIRVCLFCNASQKKTTQSSSEYGHKVGYDKNSGYVYGQVSAKHTTSDASFDGRVTTATRDFKHFNTQSDARYSTEIDEKTTFTTDVYTRDFKHYEPSARIEHKIDDRSSTYVEAGRDSRRGNYVEGGYQQNCTIS